MGNVSPSNGYPISPGAMVGHHQLPPTPTSLSLIGPPSGKLSRIIEIPSLYKR